MQPIFERVLQAGYKEEAGFRGTYFFKFGQEKANIGYSHIHLHVIFRCLYKPIPVLIT